MKKMLLVLTFFAANLSIAGFNWNIEQLASQLGYRNYDEFTALTADEKWSVLSYGFTDETDYQDINGHLRYGDNYDLYNQTTESVSKLIIDIYSTANKLPRIPKGLIVYRGFKLKWRKNKCFSKGEILKDKAFTSTTLNKKIANHFAFNKESGKGVLLTLQLSSAQKGILITENNEDEVLLMPNREITITHSYEKEGKCYTKAVLR